MKLDFPATCFAAGDNGMRATGISNASSTTEALQVAAQHLHCQQAWLLTLLPNARLQAVYGTALRDHAGALSDYCGESDLAWQVVIGGKSIHEIIRGIPTLLVPLREPVLPGYPGVWVFVRTLGDAGFTSKNIEAAEDHARQVESLPNRRRESAHCNVILFNSNLTPLINSCSLETFDPALRQHLLSDAKSRLGKRPRRTATRVHIRDHRDIVKNFRVETLHKLPIDGGTALAYTASPTVADWARLAESSFEQMPEIARLMPALKFMISKYSSLPGLTQIAAKAKLSPFHFHREFSALLGISPKHLMLDCQIESAGRQLQQGGVDLIAIAKSCGFAHQSHFTSRFKQATGLTPTAWRKAVRDN